MNSINVQTLATGFSAISVALGIPSFAVLLLWVINLIRTRLTAGTPSSTDFGSNPDALLLMLKGMTKVIGALGRIFEPLGKFLLNGLALVACVGLVLAIACWFTGRGLHAHANWARVSAFVLLVLAMLPSLLLALSTLNLVRVGMLAIVVLCFCGLHALGTGYTPPTP